MTTVTEPSQSTRDRLVVAAGHLFARHGIEEVPLRDIVAFAGQRNASAVHYHFGGRWPLVAALLERHADTVDGWAVDAGGLGLDELVAGLVALLRPELRTSEGRDFLRVVHELLSRYPGRWDATPEAHTGLRRLVDRLVERLTEDHGLDRRVAHARALAMAQLITYQFAERARLVDLGARLPLGEQLFVTNLRAMGIGLLTAPLPPIRPVRTPRRTP